MSGLITKSATDKEYIFKENNNFKIFRNMDKYDEVTKAVKANNGYCPCMIEKSEATRCMCEEFRMQDHEGPCRCGRYKKVAKTEEELDHEADAELAKQKAFKELNKKKKKNAGKKRSS